MKKFTFLVAALCATMMASAAVTFTGNAIGAAGTESSGSLVEKTIDGVTLSIDKGYVKIDPKFDVNWIRAYSGATMTISATSNISKIVITTTDPESSTKDKYSAAAFSASSYSVSSDKTVGTWTGSATSVTFSASAQVRMISVEVTLGEGGEGEGGEGGGSEEGGEVAIKDVDFMMAYYYTYEEQAYWDFDIYNYDNEYPELYIEGAVATSKSSIAGTYDFADVYGTYYTSENDSVLIESGSVTISYTGDVDSYEDPIYSVVGTLVGEDGVTYTIDVQIGTEAFDVDAYAAGTDQKECYLTLEDVVAIRTVEIDNTVYARDGRIYAEEDARIYSLTGLDVTRMNGNLEGIYIVKNGNKVAKVAVAK